MAMRKGRAIGQILDRRYYERFHGGGLPVVLVGSNFDTARGRLTNWAETTAATQVRTSAKRM